MLDVARGDARAQYNLALLFDQGRGGLPQDGREAVRLLKLAAEQGLAAAQCSLGAKYAQGGGALPQDDHKAALLFELAADQGDAAAQCDLGVFCEFGRGGAPRDERRAARLFKLAADKGVPVAQYYLGRMYEQGRGGLPQDARAANRLLKLAADHGLSAAQAELKPGLFARLFGGGADKGRDAQERQRQAGERFLHARENAERRRQAEAPERDRKARRQSDDRRRDETSGDMNADRALEILGIGAQSSEDEIHVAYNHLMKRVHPDLGGSAYFAMELNAARDALMQNRRRGEGRA
jgi:TPR repeat protein